jgi:hypothetical protein
MPMTNPTRPGIPCAIWRGAALAALLLFCSCSAPPADVVAIPRVLPLDYDGDLSDIEFSSLTWWGDRLFILPQYPTGGGRGVFTLHRDSIARAIAELESGRTPAPLRLQLVPTERGGVPSRVHAYDGLEAIAVRDGRCFALAEFGEHTDEWGSWLVAGSVEWEGGGIGFERLGHAALTGPEVRPNFTHEALVLTDREVWVISELNGRAVTHHPVVARFTRELDELPPLPMASLEYRVTDATELDDEGRFWVVNLFWPPDADVVRPPVESGPIERLVPLRFTGDRIDFDPARPVIDLRGSGDHPMHNWEGVARWGEDGFLLCSDSYPANLLAYVELPD